jgi:hypothetical protein
MQLCAKGIRFLHVDVNDVSEISVSSVPSLVYFKNGDPYIYEENLMNEDRILAWAEHEYKTNQEVIEDVSTEQVHRLLEEYDYVLVFLCKYVSVRRNEWHCERHNELKMHYVLDFVVIRVLEYNFYYLHFLAV